MRDKGTSRLGAVGLCWIAAAFAAGCDAPTNRDRLGRVAESPAEAAPRRVGAAAKLTHTARPRDFAELSARLEANYPAELKAQRRVGAVLLDVSVDGAGNVKMWRS